MQLESFILQLFFNLRFEWVNVDFDIGRRGENDREIPRCSFKTTKICAPMFTREIIYNIAVHATIRNDFNALL